MNTNLNLHNKTLSISLNKYSLSIGDIIELLPHIADELKLEYALISSRCGDKWRTRVIAFWIGNDYGKGFEYDLDGAPCEYIFQNGPHCFASDIQNLFPQDKDLARLKLQSYAGVPLLRDNETAGHIAVMDQNPIQNCAQVLTLLITLSNKWDQK